MSLFPHLPPTAATAMLLLGGLALTIPASAQAIRPVPPGVEIPMTASGLTAYGHAELKLKPDVAYIDIGVVNQARDQADAVRTNATRATVVLNALKGSGLAEKDIQTQFYGVQPQYDYPQGGAPVLIGYQVTNSVRVTVRDLAKVGQVIDKVTQAGGNQVNGVTFDLADRSKAQGDALYAAVTVAKVKAAGMAQAAGVSLGRLVSLTEGTAPVVAPMAMEMRAAVAGGGTPQTPISAQQITVTADVTAMYAIGL